MPSVAQAPARASSRALRVAFVLLVFASLLAGIAGGLVRSGVALPGLSAGGWIGEAVVAHAFLMICTFMGTVIGIERAVAVKHPMAYAGPLASAIAGLALLCGAATAARWLVLGASLAFVGVNVLIVLRQRAAHTVLLLAAAVAWAAGCLLYAANPQAGAVVPLWFSFLVLTIAAERLEMTRLMRRRAGAAPALHSILGGMLLGAAASQAAPAWGGVLYGLALLCLAAWLLCFDIARRTVSAHGLSRYMAVCLLLGYAWLGISGVAWVATSLGMPFRDAALHGLALGFVFSMMLGHAPVILPAIARVKVLFGWAYYAPLALLHGSLLVRLGWGHVDFAALAAGAAGNALAIGLFALTVAGSALAWRLKHSRPRIQRHHDVAIRH